MSAQIIYWFTNDKITGLYYWNYQTIEKQVPTKEWHKMNLNNNSNNKSGNIKKSIFTGIGIGIAAFIASFLLCFLLFLLPFIADSLQGDGGGSFDFLHFLLYVSSLIAVIAGIVGGLKKYKKQ